MDKALRFCVTVVHRALTRGRHSTYFVQVAWIPQISLVNLEIIHWFPRGPLQEHVAGSGRVPEQVQGYSGTSRFLTKCLPNEVPPVFCMWWHTRKSPLVMLKSYFFGTPCSEINWSSKDISESFTVILYFPLLPSNIIPLSTFSTCIKAVW